MGFKLVNDPSILSGPSHAGQAEVAGRTHGWNAVFPIFSYYIISILESQTLDLQITHHPADRCF